LKNLLEWNEIEYIILFYIWYLLKIEYIILFYIWYLLKIEYKIKIWFSFEFFLSVRIKDKYLKFLIAHSSYSTNWVRLS